MSKLLKDLDWRFKNLAYFLLASFDEAGIPCMIINTRRTAEEQAANVANGTSWVKHSKHEDGLAIDVCPYEIYTSAPGGDKLAWDAKNPLWQKIGSIGESIGLRWGGRWKIPDLGHFEYRSLEERFSQQAHEGVSPGMVPEEQGTHS